MESTWQSLSNSADPEAGGSLAGRLYPPSLSAGSGSTNDGLTETRRQGAPHCCLSLGAASIRGFRPEGPILSARARGPAEGRAGGPGREAGVLSVGAAHPTNPRGAWLPAVTQAVGCAGLWPGLTESALQAENPEWRRPRETGNNAAPLVSLSPSGRRWSIRSRPINWEGTSARPATRLLRDPRN